MITSKLTSKGQTTVPQPVRNALKLAAGDELIYVIEGDKVVVRRATADDFIDPFATFTEWAGEADRKAYAKF
ncbi:MAG: type II toxin-antitoxin system PrlF family antitoxin [Devosia sp.]